MKTNMKTRLTAMILAAAIPFTVVTTFAAEEPYEINEVSVGEAVEALYEGVLYGRALYKRDLRRWVPERHQPC